MMKEETRQQIQQKAEVSISDFTELIREADRLFETVGGSTRHYVSDCLLPLMEEKGMKLISTAGAEWMAGEADRLREERGELRELVLFAIDRIDAVEAKEAIKAMLSVILQPKLSDHA